MSLIIPQPNKTKQVQQLINECLNSPYPAHNKFGKFCSQRNIVTGKMLDGLIMYSIEARKYKKSYDWRVNAFNKLIRKEVRMIDEWV